MRGFDFEDAVLEMIEQHNIADELLVVSLKEQISDIEMRIEERKGMERRILDDYAARHRGAETVTEIASVG